MSPLFKVTPLLVTSPVGGQSIRRETRLEAERELKKKKRDRDGASNDAGGPSKKATSSEAASSLAITASDFAAGFFAAVP